MFIPNFIRQIRFFQTIIQNFSDRSILEFIIFQPYPLHLLSIIDERIVTILLYMKIHGTYRHMFKRKREFLLLSETYNRQTKENQQQQSTLKPC